MAPFATARTAQSPSTTPIPLALAELVGPQLRAVDQLFARELASDLPNVNDLVTHVAKFRGKMLRPMLVLLSGLAVKGGDRPLDFGDECTTSGSEADLVTMATVVEMVHMATL